MRTTLRIVGALLVLTGGVWFLQGINVLPGSFMTGQIRWAVYGGLRRQRAFFWLAVAAESETARRWRQMRRCSLSRRGAS